MSDQAPTQPTPSVRDLQLNAAGEELYAFIASWHKKHSLTAWEYVDLLAALMRHQTTKIRLLELAQQAGYG